MLRITFFFRWGRKPEWIPCQHSVWWPVIQLNILSFAELYFVTGSIAITLVSVLNMKMTKGGVLITDLIWCGAGGPLPPLRSLSLPLPCVGINTCPDSEGERGSGDWSRWKPMCCQKPFRLISSVRSLATPVLVSAWRTVMKICGFLVGPWFLGGLSKRSNSSLKSYIQKVYAR